MSKGRWDYLLEDIQRARDTYYELALDRGEREDQEHSEDRYYGRVDMCDEILTRMRATPE